MGVQIVGDTKTRKAAEETGLPIFRALVYTNHKWDGFVRNGKGHYHVTLDPRTWDWEVYEGCRFSTCNAGEWGPNVPPESNRDSVIYPPGTNAVEAIRDAVAEEFPEQDVTT